MKLQYNPNQLLIEQVKKSSTYLFFSKTTTTFLGTLYNIFKFVCKLVILKFDLALKSHNFNIYKSRILDKFYPLKDRWCFQ